MEKEFEPEHKANIYKVWRDCNYSNRKIVSMIPGDPRVAGCYFLGGFYG